MQCSLLIIIYYLGGIDLLEEYKQLHERKAIEVLGDEWRKENKNKLFYKCLEYENTNKLLYEAYFSAIIVRYFNLVVSYTYKAKNAFTAEDCYEWLLDVIMRALKERPWEKGSGNRLENDKNGPDKYVNVCMKSRVQGFYQWSNAAKRADSFVVQTSLENMMEITGDSQMPGEDNISNVNSNMIIKDIVKERFEDNDFTGAFIIDGIVNYPCIDYEQDKETNYVYSQFNKKKLSKHIRTLDDSYCKLFSNLYDVPLDKVTMAKDICNQLSSTKIYTKLNKTLLKLSKIKSNILLGGN